MGDGEGWWPREEEVAWSRLCVNAATAVLSHCLLLRSHAARGGVWLACVWVTSGLREEGESERRKPVGFPDLSATLWETSLPIWRPLGQATRPTRSPIGHPGGFRTGPDGSGHRVPHKSRGSYDLRSVTVGPSHLRGVKHRASTLPAWVNVTRISESFKISNHISCAKPDIATHPRLWWKPIRSD